MARRPRVTYELDQVGPFFMPGRKQRVKGALAEGVQDVGKRGEELYRGFVIGGGFTDTGAFADSITSDFRRRSKDVVGYAKVEVQDSYPKPGRPTATWMERGTRRGVRLRKGIRAGNKSARQLRKLDFSQIFGGRLLKRMQ